MAVFSELSILELDAERGELLPEREALQTINLSFGANTQANAATPTATQTSTGAGADHHRNGVPEQHLHPHCHSRYPHH